MHIEFLNKILTDTFLYILILYSAIYVTKTQYLISAFSAYAVANINNCYHVLCIYNWTYMCTNVAQYELFNTAKLSSAN